MDLTCNKSDQSELKLGQANGKNDDDNAIEASDVKEQPQKQHPKRRRKKTRAEKRRERFPQYRQGGLDTRCMVKYNEHFVEYYKRQPIFKNEGEFDVFMDAMRETLPASFRINAFDMDQAAFLKRLVQGPEFSDFINHPTASLIPEESTIEKSEDDNSKVVIKHYNGQDIELEDPYKRENPITMNDKAPALQSLDWYPKHLAWQMNISRVQLRKIPILQKLHKFLQAETETGFISRQEAVSMIPPLLLDVHRGHIVLDMCAAPGSKTAQLLEFLKLDLLNTGRDEYRKLADPFDDGLVVANDVDNKRCYMLVHQSGRLNSPNCVITNQDAARMPLVETATDDTGDGFEELKFDRILCDVPCSGDGTARKNVDVWKKWSVANANNFHGMQYKILRRGVELLKEDGLLVYSTCSMNPTEDESVIAAILRASEGGLELEDVSKKLTNLKYYPGVSKWLVMDRDMKLVESPDQINPENSNHVHLTLFPPSEEEAKSFKLERCVRVLPHLQNTGGFFVALIRKLRNNMPWEKPRVARVEKANNEITGPAPKKRRIVGFKEDPFIFMNKDDTDWINIKNTYRLDDAFPVNQLVHRNASGKKGNIYLVSKDAKRFILANREERGKKEFIKIINTGLRIFAKAHTDAGFRICQDGVFEILHYIKSDIKVPINKEDLSILLKTRHVGIDKISSGTYVRERIRPGSFIFIYKHLEGENSFEMPLVGWLGGATVSLYVSNQYRVHLSALILRQIGEMGLEYGCDTKENPQDGSDAEDPADVADQEDNP